MADKEIAQWLRVLTAPAQGWISIPSTHTVAHNGLQFQSQAIWHLQPSLEPTRTSRPLHRHMVLYGCRQRGGSPDSPKLPSRPPCRLPTAFTAARLRSLLQSRCRQVSIMPTQKECGYICGSKENGALDLLPLSFLLCAPWPIHLGQKITTSSTGKEWIFLARSNARCL